MRTLHSSLTPESAEFHVSSETDSECYYRVNVEARFRELEITCTCPHFVHRCEGTRKICKHIDVVHTHLLRVYAGLLAREWGA